MLHHYSLPLKMQALIAAVFIQVQAMLQFLHLAKVLNLAVPLLIQTANLAVQLLSQAVANLAVLSLHQPAAVFLAEAAVTTLANQLNVITVRMESHSAFFLLKIP